MTLPCSPNSAPRSGAARPCSNMSLPSKEDAASSSSSSVPLEPGTRPAPIEGEIEFDPPLGSVPDFTASIPILQGAAERWRKHGGSIRLLNILKEGDNVKALRALIWTTMAMFGFPLFVMGAAYAGLPSTVIAEENRMIWAGVAAIAAVQVVIIGFLWHAFNESDDSGGRTMTARGGDGKKEQ